MVGQTFLTPRRRGGSERPAFVHGDWLKRYGNVILRSHLTVAAIEKVEDQITVQVK